MTNRSLRDVLVLLLPFAAFLSLNSGALGGLAGRPAEAIRWLAVGLLTGTVAVLVVVQASRSASALGLSVRRRRIAGWLVVVGIALLADRYLTGATGAALLLGAFVPIAVVEVASLSGWHRVPGSP